VDFLNDFLSVVTGFSAGGGGGAGAALAGSAPRSISAMI